MGENPKIDAFHNVRGQEGWKEAEFALGDTKLKVAIASGLQNASALLDAISTKKVAYDFVEVMACPGGCAGGGGQPIHDNKEMAAVRTERIYLYDEKNPLRFSHENQDVKILYEEFLKEPNSHLAHHLLHVEHSLN